MSVRPGQVYAFPRARDNPEQLLVVLSDERTNRRTGYTVTCPFTETGSVGGDGSGSLFHSLSPSPGFLAWPMVISVLTEACTNHRGDVEPRPLKATRDAIAARFKN